MRPLHLCENIIKYIREWQKKRKEQDNKKDIERVYTYYIYSKEQETGEQEEIIEDILLELLTFGPSISNPQLVLDLLYSCLKKDDKKEFLKEEAKKITFKAHIDQKWMKSIFGESVEDAKETIQNIEAILGKPSDDIEHFVMNNSYYPLEEVIKRKNGKKGIFHFIKAQKIDKKVYYAERILSRIKKEDLDDKEQVAPFLRELYNILEDIKDDWRVPGLFIMYFYGFHMKLDPDIRKKIESSDDGDVKAFIAFKLKKVLDAILKRNAANKLSADFLPMYA